MLVYGFEFVMSAYDFGQVSAAMQIPIWIVYLVVPLSGVLLIVRFVQRIIDPVSSAEMHAAEPAC
jgi:C4-dicarboxylate transporter DctQ subunit